MIFNQAGPQNTDGVLSIVRDAVEFFNVKTVVLASTSGNTALKALKILYGEFTYEAGINTETIKHEQGEGFDGAKSNYTAPKLVVVSHVAGFKEPDLQELPLVTRQILESSGVTVVTAAHSMGSLGRAVRLKFGTYDVDELFANTLRLFGHGTKVAVEIAMMAVDAGAVSSNEAIIAIGGTGVGADTALLLQPANTHRFFDIKIDQILCKPAMSPVWKHALNKESRDEV